MKKFALLILIVFISSSSAFALPDNLKNSDTTFTVYDCTSDVALRNKLEDDFHKKYTKKVNENYYIDTSPMGAYYWEVQVPYDLNKKQLKDCPIISKEVLKSK